MIYLRTKHNQESIKLIHFKVRTIDKYLNVFYLQQHVMHAIPQRIDYWIDTDRLILIG